MDKIILKVKVAPRAKKNEIVGWQNNVLKIKINALPVKGKANQELIKFLADKLNIKKGQIRIVKGLTNRKKEVELINADKNVLRKIKK
ncbi:YggU family protein [bacterium]|nr:YggU family protein [bacterium]